MKINYNETFGCYELLTWDAGWKETGLSFESEAEAVEYCESNGIELD